MQHANTGKQTNAGGISGGRARSEVDDIPEVGVLRIVVTPNPKYGPGFSVEAEGNSFRVVITNKDRSTSSAAADAGLQNGDLLLELNGQQVVDHSKIKKDLKGKGPINLSVLRVFDFSTKADSDEEESDALRHDANWDAADLFNPTMLQFWCVICSANKKLDAGIITSIEYKQIVLVTATNAGIDEHIFADLLSSRAPDLPPLPAFLKHGAAAPSDDAAAASTHPPADTTSTPVQSTPVQSAAVQSTPTPETPVHSTTTASTPVHSTTPASTPVQSTAPPSTPVQSTAPPSESKTNTTASESKTNTTASTSVQSTTPPSTTPPSTLVRVRFKSVPTARTPRVRDSPSVGYRGNAWLVKNLDTGSQYHVLRDMETFYAGSDLTTFTPLHIQASRLSHKDKARVVQVSSCFKEQVLDDMLTQFGVTTLTQRSQFKLRLRNESRRHLRRRPSSSSNKFE